MKRVLSGLALFALVVVALFLPGPASAAPGDNMWSANTGSAINSDGTLTMTGGNTSVETTQAFEPFEVGVGEVLSLSYELSGGATCIGGAPRVYATVGGVTVNSWDQHIGAGVDEACNGDVTLPTGKVTAIGVVWDNGQTEGTVTVTGLSVGEKSLSFNDYEVQVLDTVKTPTAVSPTCAKAGEVSLPEQTGVLYKATTADGKTTVTAEAKFGYQIKEGADTTFGPYPVAMLTEGCSQSPSPSPTTSSPNPQPTTSTSTATPSATPTSGSPTASTSPSDSLSPAAGVVGGNTGGSLPLTGPKVLGGVGLGVLLIAVGGMMIGLVKRRRENDQEAQTA